MDKWSLDARNLPAQSPIELGCQGVRPYVQGPRPLSRVQPAMKLDQDDFAQLTQPGAGREPRDFLPRQILVGNVRLGRNCPHDLVVPTTADPKGQRLKRVDRERRG